MNVNLQSFKCNALKIWNVLNVMLVKFEMC